MNFAASGYPPGGGPSGLSGSNGSSAAPSAPSSTGWFPPGTTAPAPKPPVLFPAPYPGQNGSLFGDQPHFEFGGLMWVIPGLHFNIGDRVGSTSGALQRVGIDLIFINQVEEMTLTGKGVERTFTVRCGKNHAVMSQGERFANLLAKAMAQIQNAGVHLIS